MLRGIEETPRGPADDAESDEIAEWEDERSKDIEKARKALFSAIQTIVRPKTEDMAEDSW